jgi:hypothetical protein
MNWSEIKTSISESLLSRGLKNPSIRLSSLNKIESILQVNFQDYIDNPQESFSKIKKNDFKKELSTFKLNNKLNSAESSIINEIYYRI